MVDKNTISQLFALFETSDRLQDRVAWWVFFDDLLNPRQQSESLSSVLNVSNQGTDVATQSESRGDFGDEIEDIG